MFSGIVETIGTILAIKFVEGCKQFTIAPQHTFSNLIVGESIAINGVCLTVTHFNDTTFDVTAVPETLRLTNIDLLSENNMVNLERALLANARIGGHYVQGHVDCMGVINNIVADAQSNAWLITITIPAALHKYIIHKGYITIDGMSITVINSIQNTFTVTLIPHTQLATIAQFYQVGSYLNIEVDMMGKYIEKILGAHIHANSN